MKAATGAAPGRVNLIGEHTDYSGGLVLPLALPLVTNVALAPRGDRQVAIRSEKLGDAHFELGKEERDGSFADYVKGVTWALARLGLAIEAGFDLDIRSDVPPGSGLASSAALLVATARALREALALPLDDLAIARLAHDAEHDFVGAPVGVMDQMVASMGTQGSAFFLDVRTLVHEDVPFPRDLAIVVIDSGVAHAHATGAYRERREECVRAATLLGVKELGEVDASRMDAVLALPAPLDRRARHVITENARVRDAADALRRGDAARLGALFDASHASMRDDYEVSVAEVDAIQAALRSEAGVFGARLTGGGFGGSVIALVERKRAHAIAGAALGVPSARFVVTAP
jgi:galactokinase